MGVWLIHSVKTSFGCLQTRATPRKEGPESGERPAGCRRTWLSNAGSARRLAGWSGAMAEAPWEHPASFSWPLPLYTSACPTRNRKLMADTRASCGRRFPGAADGFIARSQKEMPGWYQSTNNLSNAKGPLTESSRVEGCSRTHLGRCLGLESRQGGGALTQCSKPAPPSPADRNTAKDPDTPLLTAGAQTSFYIPHA